MELSLQAAIQAPLTSSTGEVRSLAERAADGPLFLYAIKDGCPVNHEAQRHFDALARAYGDRVRFWGISNHTPAQFAAWQRRYQPGYPVLFDPSRQVIRALGLRSSPWLARLEPDGQISASWAGYGRSVLGEENAALASAAGVEPAPLSSEGAPEKTRYG